jgi:hypothetical protein
MVQTWSTKWRVLRWQLCAASSVHTKYNKDLHKCTTLHTHSKVHEFWWRRSYSAPFAFYKYICFFEIQKYILILIKLIIVVSHLTIIQNLSKVCIGEASTSIYFPFRNLCYADTMTAMPGRNGLHLINEYTTLKVLCVWESTVDTLSVVSKRATTRI